MSRQPFLGILLASVVCMAAYPFTALATTITVTTTDDELNADGDCSLREAIQAANTNLGVDLCASGQGDPVIDTIVVPAGTYTLMLAGRDDNNAVGDLDIRDDVTITGAGAATTIIQACDVEQLDATCPAGHGVVDRVFHVQDTDAAISGVTVRHGRFGTDPGNGIFVQKFSSDATASLTLTDSVVTKNGTTSHELAFPNGGGVASQNAALTLVRVTVSDNVLGTGGGNGGGIGNNGAEAALVMTDCTVTGNQSGNHGGGIYNKNGSAIITGSTINGNHSVGGSGGGMINDGGTATLTNCTVSGNQSNGPYAGGLFLVGGVSNLRSCTVTLNRLVGGQGAGGLDAFGASAALLRNTIIAGNFHDIDAASSLYSPDCEAGEGQAVESEGYSLIGNANQCPGLVDGLNGDQIGTKAAPIDAKLGPLADNGGLTLTHAFLEGSPAIDAASPGAPGSGGITCPATDQRGETRPKGTACDIGAFEGGNGGALAVEAVQPARGGNAGTVQTRIYGSGFATGATVKLVRDGFADVIGVAANVVSRVITTSFDLHGVAPGAWSVVVENLHGPPATLTDAFTVEAGGSTDLWVDVLLPRAFSAGRYQPIYLLFGNRGTVDAYGVPVWLAFSDELQWHVPFVVSPPPAQPGQLATDWTRLAIDVPIPLPENRDSFPLLLPVVPAGSTGVLKFRVRSPFPDTPSRTSFRVSTDIGAPYFDPDLSNAVVGSYVERAKEYATTAHGTTAFPSDAAIAAYVRTQLTTLVEEGKADAVTAGGGYPPVYSQAQLVIDTGQFIAGASATASARSFDRHWLARVVSDLLSPAVEAGLIDPDCDPNDILCEREPSCANNPNLCADPPIINCDRINIDVAAHQFSFVPCKPKDDDVPFEGSLDPNDKVGPGGPGGYIDGLTPLPYTVSFENKSTATGDAFEVTVTDHLDVAKYDLATFSLGPISFGSTFVPVPSGLKTFSTEVDLRPGVNILVGIDAALDTATGVVTWKLTTLDPATHEFPENPEDGFLPPNVTSPEGEGAVLFTVGLKPGFGLGTTVCNAAHIVFDFNAPIDTPTFCNTIGAPEDCANCIDDDGDGLVDRADPDCAPAANGAGAGVGDAAAGKAVDKCAKAIRKTGAKLTSDHLKRLGACEKAVADCVQLKPGDAACLAKAKATCGKARAALPAAEAKVTAAIAKACGAPTLTGANLLAATGLGFAGETEPCGTRGLAAVGTVADVAECVRRQHVCAAELVLGAAVPRARELLVLGGFDPGADFACLATGANGGGSAVAAEKRKALRKCDAAIQKAATKVLAGRAKIVDACAAAVFTCVQTKPGDPACVTKAGGSCTKAVAGLSKLGTSFSATIAKACGAAPLVPADLLAPEGLGVAALAERCAAVGIPSLATVADVTACLERQIACRTDHALESATPRLGELLDLGGVTLP